MLTIEIEGARVLGHATDILVAHLLREAAVQGVVFHGIAAVLSRA